MSNPLQQAVDGATELVESNPINALLQGADNDVSMTRFVAAAKKYGKLLNNAASIEIYTNIDAGNNNRRLFYTCESFNLPGMRFATEDVRIQGPTRKFPYDPTYSGEFTVTFRVGQDMFERKFFEDWQALVYDADNHVWGYYEDYCGVIVLRQFDQNNANVYGVQLMEVWPLQVDSVPTDQSGKDFIRQSVTFAYRKWKRLADDELLAPPSNLPFGVPLVNGFIGKDLSNLITGSMNLASAVNTQIGNIDRAVQENVGFIKRAVNGQVIRSPFRNVGRNLKNTIKRYSGGGSGLDFGGGHASGAWD